MEMMLELELKLEILSRPSAIVTRPDFGDETVRTGSRPSWPEQIAGIFAIIFQKLCSDGKSRGNSGIGELMRSKICILIDTALHFRDIIKGLIFRDYD